jgi:lysophospholipase L1-like esterase
MDSLIATASPLIRRVMSPGQAMRRSQFEQLPLPPHCVVFLGDSITEQGVWEEWFPELATLNRGIGGDTVSGVTARLATAINEPTAISLLVGTNDLSGFGASRDTSAIAAQLRNLVEELRRRTPDAALLVNSVMPRGRSMAHRVIALNAEVTRIAADVGATYLDLWPILADRDGGLRDELSLDHLHLNGPGYEAWVTALRPLLSSLLAATDQPVEDGR